MSSSRFAVAVHLMALAAFRDQETPGMALTSEEMADSVRTNPVVIRRLLGTLQEAGLVTSQRGPGSGRRLRGHRTG